MTSTLTGQFPISTNPAFGSTNIVDAIVGSPIAWTSGARIVSNLQVSPTLMSPWLILGWAITFNGFLDTTPPAFGKLGRLYGGLVPQAVNTTVPDPTPPYTRPWTNPVNLPSDTSMIAGLWDGDTDPPFPSLATANTTPSPIQTGFNLPQPIQLLQGEPLSIGMWLTPSLIQKTALYIAGAAFTILYQEQLASTASWTTPQSEPGRP